MRSMNGRLVALVPALLAGLATNALAHDTWLLPARYAVAPGETVTLDVTSAMRFPQPESPPQPDRLAATGVRLGGHTGSLDVGRVAGKVLRLSAVLGEAGVAAFWVESRPRTLTLEPKEVEHYLHEIGAPPAVRTRWQSGGQRWRESYAKLAKTYVRVGAPKTDRSWAEHRWAAVGDGAGTGSNVSRSRGRAAGHRVESGQAAAGADGGRGRGGWA